MVYLARDMDLKRNRIKEQEIKKIEWDNFIFPKSFILKMLIHYEKNDAHFKIMMTNFQREVNKQVEKERPQINNTFLR